MLNGYVTDKVLTGIFNKYNVINQFTSNSIVNIDNLTESEIKSIVDIVNYYIECNKTVYLDLNVYAGTDVLANRIPMTSMLSSKDGNNNIVSLAFAPVINQFNIYCALSILLYNRVLTVSLLPLQNN